MQVQLWDCGGDPQNEMFWPALARDAIALILVAPSNLGESDMQFLEMLYLRFGAQHGLKESQCAIFLNKLQGINSSNKFHFDNYFNIYTILNSGEQSKVSDLPKMFSKVQTEVVSLSEASSICDAFQRILGNAIKVKQEEFRKGEKEIFKLDE